MGGAFILHILIWRLFPSNHPRFGILGWILLVGYLVSVAVDAYLSGLAPSEQYVIFGLHFFFDVGYVLFFYPGISRSVSVTLMAWLLESDDGVMSLDEINQRYGSSSRFEDRVQMLHDHHFLRFENGSATLRAKGRFIGWMCEVAGRILGTGMEG